ncbi:MAG TPA: hypothetical protein PK307_16825 [Spirochaetota bacterium]|nr:hypothetical protein [Spirochaetota bacterium]HOD16642.1 hypothetical protein [Spirochaetota bacterium]HPG50269.1 hypothetical protein [Spirochaetota bacterium]HPN12292.1 hypothetical protein [Spirochaetota bacterium]HQL83866.1 hypothetical protein [Spirochaetota bacterium]
MQLTRSETLMKYAGLMYAIMFIGAVLVFICLPDIMFGMMNGMSRALFPSLPLAADAGKFWLSLTVSMMVTITALSIMIYRDVKSNYRMAVPLAVAKFTSSLFGLGFFIAGFIFPDTSWNTLANLAIMFTDAPLGFVMLALYLAVKKERG